MVSTTVVSAASIGVSLGVGDTVKGDVYVVKNTAYPLSKGVVENVLVSNNDKNEQNIGFFMTAEVANKDNHLKVVTGYRNYDGSRLGLATTTAQARAYEKANPGKTVIGATNADFYNMQTGQTLGALVMDGKVYSEINGRNFFAVLKDGSCVIADANGTVITNGAHKGEQLTLSEDVSEAVGGDQIIGIDGQLAPGLDSEYGIIRYSRSAIGVKDDGSIVTYVTHGKLPPKTYGETYEEIASKLIAAGCTSVLALDGGGSATSASKREGEAKLTVKNNPSDGSERNVASTLFIVSEATSDGTFDHASVTPTDEYYTPGHDVQFDAFGVDAYGNNADMPSDCTYALAEDSASLGTITNEGLFTSNGTVGDVTVNVVSDSKVVGSTTIHIVEPDTIGFESESLSLDFGEKSTLGFYARYKSIDINIFDGDFSWEVKSKTEGAEDSAIGTFDGNTFIAQDVDQTKQYDAEITAKFTKADGSTLDKSIDIAIGRMPDILYDFELDENGKALQAAHYSWGMLPEQANGSGPYYFKNYEGDTLDVVTSGSYSGNPTTATITEPFVFDGNFDTPVPAADIFRADGYTFYLWPNGSLDDRSVGSAAVTNAQDGHVRFGDYALDVEYDYRSYNKASNSNFYLRYCGEPIEIKGNPTELGMWVYAPEGTKNFAISACIETWNGTKYATQNIWLKTQDGTKLQYTGINWEGWKYCYADLRDLWKFTDAEHPMKILPGSGLVWICYMPAGRDENGNTQVMGGTTKGHLYFDNMRVVYGSTVDDLIDPVISKITANNVEIAKDGSTVLDNSSLSFAANYDDPEGDNRSGIDPSKTVVLVDGEKVTLNDVTENFTYFSKQLSNGTHNIRVIVQDVFGNQVSETREFTIEDTTSKTSNIKLTGKSNTYIGHTYTLSLSSSTAISDINANIAINEEFGEPKVIFANGFEGTATYEKGSLKIKASAETPESGSIASIKFKVPTTLSGEDSFTYGIASCKFTDTVGTWTTTKSTKTVKILPYYNIDCTPIVEGLSGTITVTDQDGNPVDSAEIYKVNDEEDILIGITDENGTLKTKKLSKTADEVFVIYASSEYGLSYQYKGTVAKAVGNEDGTPSNIAHNAAKDGSTGEQISWWANPTVAAHKAVVQYMTAADYESNTENAAENATEIEGKSSLKQFVLKGKESILLNQATINGLEPATTYTYRVGDGENWSEWKSFKTTANDGKATKFFVIGDTQLLGNYEEDAEAIEMLNEISKQTSAFGADFGIQTGDYIDNAGYFDKWNEIQNVFENAFGSTDIIHTMGNHEYYGETTGTLSANMFQLSNKDYYSVEYNNVYVAVINNSADLNEVATWLEKDAKASDCKWKVLSIHQPAYYTNAKGGNEGFNENIPPIAEAAGIDIVFSGHDHSYARTMPLTKGEVDEENGITYFICGDLGEKSREADYAISTTDKFHFAEATQDYDAIHLEVTATKESLKVEVKDLDGTVIDEYELLSDCEKYGHKFVFDPETQTAICSECNEVNSNFTGLIQDKDDQTYYLQKGVITTGWKDIIADDGEGVMYYFDKNGTSKEVTIKEDVKTTCVKRGYCVYQCKDASTPEEVEYKISYARASGHDYNSKRVCKVCGWKEISLSDCKISTHYTYYTYRAKPITPVVTVTYKGKALEQGVDYRVTYTNNTECGIAKATVKPITKFLGDKVNHRGTLAPGNKSKTFYVRPKAMTSLTATAVDTNSIKLNWKAVEGATRYEIYRYSTKTKAYEVIKTVGNVTSTEVGNLYAGSYYKFRVRGYVTASNNTIIRGNSAYAKVITKPSRVTNVTLKAGKSQFTANWNKTKGTGYQVRYSTNSSFTSYKTVTTTDSAVVSKTIKNLTKGKTYYVKVRAYRSVTNCNTAYGKWSSAKTVKVVN